MYELAYSREALGPQRIREWRAVYKAIQASRLYEQIVQQIEQSILKGVLKAGDQLPAERDLAQQFGVSRTAAQAELSRRPIERRSRLMKREIGCSYSQSCSTGRVGDQSRT